MLLIINYNIKILFFCDYLEVYFCTWKNFFQRLASYNRGTHMINMINFQFIVHCLRPIYLIHSGLIVSIISVVIIIYYQFNSTAMFRLCTRKFRSTEIYIPDRPTSFCLRL